MVKKFDHIYATISDSPIPLLALIQGFSAKSITLWFTPEKRNKVPYLKRFFEAKRPETDFNFVEIPSMNEPANQVLAIKKEISKQSESNDLCSAVFVSAGTTTMALSMWHHAKALSWISLRKGLLLKVFSPNEDKKTSIVLAGDELTLQQILISQGWIYNGGILQHENGRLEEPVFVSYSASSGELSFVKNTHEMSDSKDQERAVSFMCGLTDEFGLNGANYEIRGPLSKRALNLMNDVIVHSEGGGEEE